MKAARPHWQRWQPRYFNVANQTIPARQTWVCAVARTVRPFSYKRIQNEAVTIPMEAIARAKIIFLETKTTRFDSDPAVDAITLGAPFREATAGCQIAFCKFDRSVLAGERDEPLIHFRTLRENT